MSLFTRSRFSSVISVQFRSVCRRSRSPVRRAAWLQKGRNAVCDFCGVGKNACFPAAGRHLFGDVMQTDHGNARFIETLDRFRNVEPDNGAESFTNYREIKYITHLAARCTPPTLTAARAPAGIPRKRINCKTAASGACLPTPLRFMILLLSDASVPSGSRPLRGLRFGTRPAFPAP